LGTTGSSNTNDDANELDSWFAQVW